jgi:hypothetical protein
MATTDEYELDNRSDGGRDPRRPPGLMLVVVAFVLLASLGYAIYPHGVSTPAPEAGGGGPSANTNPAQSPAGK